MKLFSVVSLALLLTILVTAPTSAQIEFSIGTKGGLNFGTLSLTPEQLNAGATKGGRTGAMFGAAAEIGFAKMFYVALEPTYCGKGCSFTFPGGTQTLIYNYLNLPVLFKVKFLKGTFRPYGFLGPNLGILLSATNKVEVTGNQGGGGETDLKQFTSGTDFALDFGAGLEFNIVPKIALTGDVRYSLGLGDINNTPAQPGVTAVKLTTGGFQVLFGAMFHIM